MYDQSKLFCQPGYIALREYLADIDHMDKYGPWKLPLRPVDRLQLKILKGLTKISWFADVLYIKYPSSVSPAYSLITAYLRKRGFLGLVGERDSRCPGRFSYVITTEVSTAARKGKITGQGVAGDRATALSKSIGETLERLITGVHDTNPRVVVASPEKMLKDDTPILYPPRHHRYLASQRERYPEVRHDPGASIEWVEGRNLATMSRVFIPKKMTSWYVANGRKNNIFVPATTNGSAGFFTRQGAVLRGLLEVVQRDGLLVHWLTMISPRSVDVDTLPEHLLTEVRKLESLGLSIHVLDVTSLQIPSVVIAAMSDQSDTVPQIVLSAAADLTFEAAIGNGLRELVNGLEMFLYPESGSPTGIEFDEAEPFLSKLGKLERQLYWRGESRVSQFRWFVSGPKVAYQELCKLDIGGLENDSQRLRWCLKILEGLGAEYSPLVYFPKNSIQKELGFYVAQVFIPKAFPLYLIEYLGTFESDRLEEFAKSKEVFDWKLNPLPHMFS